MYLLKAAPRTNFLSQPRQLQAEPEKYEEKLLKNLDSSGGCLRRANNFGNVQNISFFCVLNIDVGKDHLATAVQKLPSSIRFTLGIIEELDFVRRISVVLGSTWWPARSLAGKDILFRKKRIMTYLFRKHIFSENNRPPV